MTPNNRPEPAAQSPLLHKWLRTATWWLCPEAAERAQREITEHFVTGVAEHMASGLRQVPAEAAALRDLGPPRAARRRLHKTDLTLSEAGIISALMNRAVLGLPPTKTGKGALSRYLVTFLNLFGVCLQLYIIYGLNSDYGNFGLDSDYSVGVLVLLSVNTVFMISNDMPSWLRRGTQSCEVDAAVIARLRQVARLQTILCVAALFIVITTTASHFFARETYEDADFRYLADFAHVSACLAVVGMLAFAAPTFRALRKLAKKNGPVQS